MGILQMSNRLKNLFEAEPERVIKWHDTQSDAEGWLVINSLYNGAAGGGTRMHSNCTEREVLQLAKTMEIKFTVSGPSIGGAKSGIRYNFRNDQDKVEVLSRWFKFIRKELRHFYGTGGDQNIDMNTHVIPALKKLGISHPQEGIVNGLYPDASNKERARIIRNLYNGVVLKVREDSLLSNLNFTIADIATGFGVVASINRFYVRTGENLFGKKVIIEGFGNVGAGAAYYATKYGAKVAGIIDKDWYIIDDNGIDIAEVLQLKQMGILETHPKFARRKRRISNYPEAHIFIPAATSHTLNRRILKKLESNGTELIALGANNAFVDYTTEKKADQAFSIIPDFIANAGMARCFSYLMKKDCNVTERAIKEDISSCINTAIDKIMDKSNSKNDLCEHAYNIALDEIERR